MTIALGINFGNYIFMAADTRINYYFQGRKIWTRDDSTKIYKTKIGLITGAGYTNLLDSVKKRLAEEEAGDTNKILEIIKEERSKHEGEIDSDSFELTKWILSYATIVNNNNKFRVALYDPSVGHYLGIVKEENKPLIIFPIEASEEEVKKLSPILEDKIKPFNEFNDLSKSIQYHFELIGIFIEAIHSKYPSMSSLFQFGIHSLAGRGISPIINIREQRIISLELDFS